MIKSYYKKHLFKFILTGFIVSFLTSCSLFHIGKQRVFYSEMSRIPLIETHDYNFTIITGNSNKNSALLIYKINAHIDEANKVISLDAYQAIGKKYKDRFKIKCQELSKIQLDTYKFYWVDPDNNRTEIMIK